MKTVTVKNRSTGKIPVFLVRVKGEVVLLGFDEKIVKDAATKLGGELEARLTKKPGTKGLWGAIFSASGAQRKGGIARAADAKTMKKLYKKGLKVRQANAAKRKLEKSKAKRK